MIAYTVSYLLLGLGSMLVQYIGYFAVAAWYGFSAATRGSSDVDITDRVREAFHRTAGAWTEIDQWLEARHHALPWIGYVVAWPFAFSFDIIRITELFLDLRQALHDIDAA